MVIAHYLAVTQAEIALGALPECLGYLGCHFGEYGLRGLPDTLPQKSILIVDDRVPMAGQSPQRILSQLRECFDSLHFVGLLLDFQQPGNEAQRALTLLLSQKLPVPVAVSPAYACPECRVFLPPVPPNQTLSQALAPWAGRKIWLDTSVSALQLTLTTAGCRETALPRPTAPGKFTDPELCCRYSILETPEGVQFTLFRDIGCIQAMLEKAEPLGVELAMGLWQELGEQTES